jgi:hypothetical protein
VQGIETYRLRSCIRRLDGPLRGRFPYVVRGDIVIGPWHSEQRRIPSHHGRWFFISQEKVIESACEALNNIYRHNGAILTFPGDTPCHPACLRSTLCRAPPLQRRRPARIWVRLQLKNGLSTHSANAELKLSRSTIHLVSKSLNVIHGIHDEDRVLRHFPLYSSKQGRSCRLF